MMTEAQADEQIAVHRDALDLIRAVAGQNWDGATAILDAGDTRKLTMTLAMMLVRELRPLVGGSTHSLLATLDRYRTETLIREDDIRRALTA